VPPYVARATTKMSTNFDDDAGGIPQCGDRCVYGAVLNDRFRSGRRNEMAANCKRLLRLAPVYTIIYTAEQRRFSRSGYVNRGVLES